MMSVGELVMWGFISFCIVVVTLHIINKIVNHIFQKNN